MILFLLAVGIMLPAAGSPLLDVPRWQMAAGHAVYGLALGYLFGRAARRPEEARG
jgi:hypothetical protein